MTGLYTSRKLQINSIFCTTNHPVAWRLMIVFEELESLVYGVRADVDEVVTEPRMKYWSEVKTRRFPEALTGKMLLTIYLRPVWTKWHLPSWCLKMFEFWMNFIVVTGFSFKKVALGSMECTGCLAISCRSRFVKCHQFHPDDLHV